MKRWIRNTLTIGLCLIPVAAIIGFSNSWSNKTPISCVGSSGVKPFVEELSQKYQKNNKKVDITIEAGGSGFGIEQVAEGYANIGNASKDPYGALVDPKADPTIQDKWINNKIKTVTIGWEAICNVFIPPANFEYKGEMNPNNILVVNDESIRNFMRIFSGIPEGIDWASTTHYDQSSDSKLPDNSMWFFRNHEFDSNWSSKDKQLLQSTPIIPYVRSGGSLTSGTASSFVGSSRLDFSKKDDLKPDQQAAFDSGNYGTSFNLQQTDEANSRAWDMFSKSNKPGQVVYLSSGFVCSKSNAKLIEKKKYGIMAYQHATSDVVPFEMDKVNKPTNGYNWFRPLNCLISLNSKNTIAENFLHYLINNSGTVDGCLALDLDTEQNQLEPFDSSDAEIAVSRYKIDIKDLWVTDPQIKWDGKAPHFAVIPSVDLDGKR